MKAHHYVIAAVGGVALFAGGVALGSLSMGVGGFVRGLFKHPVARN